MRLLELTGDRIRLQTFQTSIPSYAILSHTWGEDVSEIKFEDLEDGYVPVQTDLNRPGHRKLMFCAKQAQRDGLRYFWVDSCCIDQQNRRELEESIARMFQWYHFAAKCYVYLSDVSFDGQGTDDNLRDWQDAFCQSRWFTRGWTLQELLAPRSVEFFSRQGSLLGTRQSLENHIHTTTNIPVDALRGRALELFPVEERMKWAENRKTKKIEDRAYCLQGIFNVFLPTLYGEGEHAFIRLQQAIDTYLTYSNVRHSRKRRRDEEDSGPSLGRRVYTEPVSVHPTASIPTRSSTPLPGIDQAPSRYDDLIDVLSFEQIDDRFENIKANLARTCRWLLSAREFKDWLDSGKMTAHHGFFWIRGKPGCGKSTLTKFCFQHLKKKMMGSITLSFFFNARGAELEKSTIGLYRSLLLQLIKLRGMGHKHRFESLFASQSLDKLVTSCDSLKTVLRQTLEEDHDQSVIIVIDALDEGNEDDVRDMIRYFSDIATQAADEGRTFRIFFSSRHYPYITIQPSIGIVVEDQSGHSQDLEVYIHSQLGVKGRSAENLRIEIQRRASGIFMWVVLVVTILNKLHDRGQQEKELLKELRKIPSDLYELLRSILTRDAEDLDAMKLCMQWILYSRQPMSPAALHHAILIGMNPADPDFGIVDLPALEDSSDQSTEVFLIHHSKGLAEVTKTKLPKVQFIHESVRDFLLKEHGLGYIWPDLRACGERQSHNALKICCIAQLNPEIVCVLGLSQNADELPKAKTEEAKALVSRATNRFPFLEYAVRNVLYHAQKAQASISVECSFLEVLRRMLPTWIIVNNLFETHQIRRQPRDIDIGYLLSERNCAVLLQLYIRISNADGQSKGRYGDYMFAALANGADEVFDLLAEGHNSPYLRTEWFPRALETTVPFLLDHTTQASAKRFLDRFPHQKYTDGTPSDEIHRQFCRTLNRGRHDIAHVLLEAGVLQAHRAVRDQAIQSSFLKLEREEALDIWVQSLKQGLVAEGTMFEMFTVAFRGNHTQMMRTLWKHLSTLPLPWWTAAISKAVNIPHSGVARLLLAHSVAALSGNNSEFGPLVLVGYPSKFDLEWLFRAALILNDTEHAEALLNYVSDVNSITGHYGSLLAMAAHYGSEDLSRALLNRGAQVNSALRGDFGSALIAACKSHLKDAKLHIIRLLMENGADLNAIGNPSCPTAFHAALSQSTQTREVIALLIDGGLLLDTAPGFNLLTALEVLMGHSIVQRNIDEAMQIVDLLLARGVKVDARLSGKYGTPLIAAASQYPGHYSTPKMVEFLLERGADVNAFGNEYYGSALAAAAAAAACVAHQFPQGIAVVKILVDRGAQVNAFFYGHRYTSALAAACSGIQGSKAQVAQFLKSHGAM